MAAEYPSIAKPEAQISDKFWGVNITAFKKRGDKIQRYGRILKKTREEESHKAIAAMIKETTPDYIIAVFYDGINPPGKISEKGDKKVMTMFLDEAWRRIR